MSLIITFDDKQKITVPYPYDEDIMNEIPANKVYIVQTVNLKWFTPHQQLNQMRSFVADNNLESIHHNFNPENLLYIRLPSTLNFIGGGFLKNNKFIQEFIIPHGVTDIADDFMCGSVVQRVMSDGMLQINGFISDMLNDCKQLQYVNISIWNSPIQRSMCDCPKLEQVQIVGKYALLENFKNSPNIKHIILRVFEEYEAWFKQPFDLEDRKLQYADISPLLNPDNELQELSIRTLEEYQTMYQQLQQMKQITVNRGIQKKESIDKLQLQQNELQMQMYNAIEFGME